jgi:hypothetical protein
LSKTGRFYIKAKGRTFCVEPIDNTDGNARERFGNINPVTKKVEGDYGDKYRGSIHEDDSIITEDNGFKNIVTLDVGVSPNGYIEHLLSKDERTV